MIKKNEFPPRGGEVLVMVHTVNDPMIDERYLLQPGLIWMDRMSGLRGLPDIKSVVLLTQLFSKWNTRVICDLAEKQGADVYKIDSFEKVIDWVKKLTKETITLRTHTFQHAGLSVVANGQSQIELTPAEKFFQAACLVWGMTSEEFLKTKARSPFKMAAAIAMRKGGVGFPEIAMVLQITEREAVIASLLGDMEITKGNRFEKRVLIIMRLAEANIS